MSKMIRQIVLAALLLGLAGCVGLPGLGKQDFELRIVHVNDTHARLEPVRTQISLNGTAYMLDLGGFPALATKVAGEKRKAPDTVFLHAGDVFQGTLYFTKYHGEADVKLLNMMRPAAMCPGNHEFDAGTSVLAEFIRQAGFPVASSNIRIAEDSPLHGLIRPYVILNVKGQAVGVIGATTTSTAETPGLDPEVRFTDESRAVGAAVRDLARQGVDKIVLLSHVGYFEDLRIARNIDGIDIIVGGHSHTLLGRFEVLGLSPQNGYPTKVSGPTGRLVCVVQAWEWGKAVGNLDVLFDERGNVRSCEGGTRLLAGETVYMPGADGQAVPLDGADSVGIRASLAATGLVEFVRPDPEVAAALEPFAKGVHVEMNMKVAEVAEPIGHIRIPGVGADGSAQPEGSLIAPLVARSDFEKLADNGLKPDLAFIAGGNVRRGLPKGDLSVGVIYELLPFPNTIHLIDLTGRELRSAIEFGVDKALEPDRDGAFPYLYNAWYAAEASRPVGERVTAIEVFDAEGAWKPLDDTKVYRVAMNGYLAKGGNGYAMFRDSKGQRTDSGFFGNESFIEFARKQGVLHRPDMSGVEFNP